MKEEEIYKGCLRKDRKSQQLLYDLYENSMYRLCYRYVKEEKEAEDILVQGFLKTFKNIERFEFRGEGSLQAWMKRIMVNESLHFLRKVKKIELVLEEAGQIPAENNLLEDLDAEYIYKAILALPLGYRTVFNLYVIEGYSHKEIGDQLDISENTSRSQLNKARKALQKILTGKEYEVR